MPPFTPAVSVQADPDISFNLEPMTAIRIVGCLVVFIGFSFVVRKVCFASPSSTSHRQSFPSCQHQRPHPAARLSRASPTASIPRCLACQKARPYAMADKSARVPQRSPLRTTPAPPPHSPRHGPTGMGPRVQSWRPASSSVSASTNPTTPPSPPLGYGARGPTASLHPVVW